MPRLVAFCPPEEAIDSSLDARKFMDKLASRVDLRNVSIDTPPDEIDSLQQAHSVCVVAGLSSLEPESGYMEMGLNGIFEPKDVLSSLREALPERYPLVAIVDDAYSRYLMSAYLRAGASAVVGTNGTLFGLVRSRLHNLRELLPYINAYEEIQDR
jgi:hypothetical protein